MLFQPVKLEDKLHKRQLQSKVDVLAEVRVILDADNKRDDGILETLSTPNKHNTNAFNVDILEHDRIYHIDTIKTICIDYRLRFLDSHYFKGDLPYEAISKIKALEKEHNTQLNGFKIMAPAKLLKLENADDPLLFAPIGNGYYYLIHKWGNDLSAYRKWIMLPFKSLENLLITALLSSYILSLIIPHGDIKIHSSQFWLIFLFMFKSVVAIILYYAFARGKNVSAENWNSKYYNA